MPRSPKARNLFKAELEIVWRGDTAAAHAVLRQAMEKIPVGDLVGRLQRPGSVSALLFRDSSLAPALDAVTLDAFDGDSALYYHSKTELHYTRRDPRRARAYADCGRAFIEARLREHPDDSQLRGRLGFAYAVLGRNAEAAREGQRAVELLPTSRDALGGTFRLANPARIYTVTGRSGCSSDCSRCRPGARCRSSGWSRSGSRSAGTRGSSGSSADRARAA